MDPCVYFRRHAASGLLTILAVFVDDILFASTSSCAASDFFKEMSAVYNIVDLGVPKHMIGLGVDVRPGVIRLQQTQFIIDLADKFGQTAVHKAAYFNHPDLCEALISMGANQQLEDNECRKPSDICRIMGNKEAGRALGRYQTSAALAAADRRQKGISNTKHNKDLRKALARMHRIRQKENGGRNLPI